MTEPAPVLNLPHAETTWEQDLANALATDPAFAAAYTAETTRMERSVSRDCPFGACHLWLDPHDGTILGGIGSPMCGCDNLPGWRARRWDGLAKPATPALVRGRNGSRVARSRARHAGHRAWLAQVTR